MAVAILTYIQQPRFLSDEGLVCMLVAGDGSGTVLACRWVVNRVDGLRGGLTNSGCCQHRQPPL